MARVARVKHPHEVASIPLTQKTTPIPPCVLNFLVRAQLTAGGMGCPVYGPEGGLEVSREGSRMRCRGSWENDR